MAESLSKRISCGHCYNIAPMEIIGAVNEIKYEPEIDGPGGNQGDVYEILKCPSCKKTNIVAYFWHDFMDSYDDVNYEILYPQNTRFPQGLPENIMKTLSSSG